jgi:hypothetical protein
MEKFAFFYSVNLPHTPGVVGWPFIALAFRRLGLAERPTVIRTLPGKDIRES